MGGMRINKYYMRLYSFFSFSFRRSSRRLFSSLTSPTIRGIEIGPKSGRYTAKRCSGGKYSIANMLGLKKARDDSVFARAEN